MTRIRQYVFMLCMYSFYVCIPLKNSFRVGALTEIVWTRKNYVYKSLTYAPHGNIFYMKSKEHEDPRLHNKFRVPLSYYHYQIGFEIKLLYNIFKFLNCKFF